MTDSVNLEVSYLAEGQDKGEVAVNELINRMDAAVLLCVKDRDLTSPPSSPSDGDRYIVGGSATGEWASEDTHVAGYYGGWIFLTPQEGWWCFVQDENCFIKYSGSAWQVSGPIATLTQSISASPTQAEVTAIQNKLNTVITELRTTGILKT